MKLKLTRKTYTKTSTIGDLQINGKFECHVLEDPVRPKKIKGVTAIPAGSYKVVITWSPRFKVDMPLLEDVPGFEGIRIHPGNTAEHTEGCLLVGKTKAVDSIGSSRDAYAQLFKKLKKALGSGGEIGIEIVEGGVSPYMAEAEGVPPASVPGKKGQTWRITADPLRMRSSEDASGVSNILARLPLGTLVTTTGRAARTGWLHVRAELDGAAHEGFISSEYAEAVPLPGDASKAEPLLFRVNASSLNLRKEPANLDDKAILASLPRGLLVTRLAGSKHPQWWEVQAVLHGKTLRGFVLSSFLSEEREGSELPSLPAAPSMPPSDAQVSEKALQLILSFEGLDQPGKWPGVASGISLGRGYDLGYHTFDQFQGDWGPHLSAAAMQRLARAIGKRGQAAKKMAPQFADIRVTAAAADEVFKRSTLPRIKANTRVAFPGVTALPPDAQGALASLVYNRGTDMNPAKDKRKEMREVRALVADAGLTMPVKLARIADAIRAMQRHWPDTPGLQRRRRAEADLVASCI